MGNPVTMIYPDGSRLRQTFDISGRLSKTVNGTTTNFHWEGDNLAMELDASFNPIRRYTYGIGKDSVEGHIEFSEASANLFAHPYGWYSYIKDQVGTIYKIFSHQTQSTVTTRHTDTFGNLLSQSGPSKGNLGFQSKYFDQESDLNYFYHRYYNPSIAKFISEDPIQMADGLNMQQFVRNNTVNNYDPYGLMIVSPPGMGPSNCAPLPKGPWKIPRYPKTKIDNYVDYFWDSLFNNDTRLEGECYWDCVKRLMDSRGVSVDFEDSLSTINFITGNSSMWGYMPKQIGYSHYHFFRGGRSCYKWANQFGSGIKATKWAQAGILGGTLSIISTGITAYTATTVLYAYVRCY